MNRNPVNQRALSLLLSLALVLSLFGADTAGAWAMVSDSGNTDSGLGAARLALGSDNRTMLYIDYGSITIGDGTVTGKDKDGKDVTPSSDGSYLIRQIGSNDITNTITVTGGTHDIYISALNIDAGNYSAFSIAKNAKVNLYLINTNTLQGLSGYPGIWVPDGAKLTILGSGSSLTAQGGKWASGIGGGDEETNASKDCGSVTINGGNVTAIGGVCGAGIGGGSPSYASKNGDGGAGGMVTINGGTVTATGGGDAAGIGGGSCGNAGGTVTINGGTVTASGSDGGAGIGGGYDGSGGTVYISGGSVRASGNSAIGKGQKGSSQGTLQNKSGGSNVYLTTVALPTKEVQGISSFSMKQSGDSYFYGSQDMSTDRNGKLYLYLPADSNTTADIQHQDDSKIYRYHGGVTAAGNPNVLNPEVKDISAVMVGAIPNHAYTGSAIRPEPTVTDDDTFLSEGTDYTVTYSNNVNIGTATVTITGTGNYTGSVSKSFTITKADASVLIDVTPVSGSASTGDEVNLATLVEGINGHSPKGTVTFYDGGTALGTGTLSSSGVANYTWNNVSAGSHTLIATYGGDDNYNAANGSISNYSVQKFTPTLGNAPSATSVPYGSALFASSLTGGEMLDANGTGIPGAFQWTDLTQRATSSGDYGVTFQPTDSNSYNQTTLTAHVNLTYSNPTISVSGNTTDQNQWAAAIPLMVATTTYDPNSSGDVTVSFSADGNTFGSPQTVTDGSYTASENGTYRFTVTDGQKQAASQNVTVTQIDKTLPNTPTITDAGNYNFSKWYNAPQTVSTKFQPTAGAAEHLQYRIGNGAWTDGASATVSSEGTTTVSFRVTDALGRNGKEASVPVNIDTVAPAAPTIDQNAGTVTSSNFAVTGTTEAGSTVTITGGVSTVTCTADKSGIYTVKVPLASGANTLCATATDAAGNTSTPSVNVTINYNDGHSSNTPTPSLPSSVTNSATGTQITLSGAAFPPSVTGVSLSVVPQTPTGAPTGTPEGKTDPQGAAAYSFAVHDSALNIIGMPHLYNIKLLDQSGNPVSFTGSVTVRIPVPAGIQGTPHVLRYESAGALTDMNAVLENGFLVFPTTHFSEYVIVETGDAITLDTTSYRMPIGGTYQIGVKLSGKKNVSVKIHSTNNSITTAAQLTNGNVQVGGEGTGTAWIMFDVYDDKNKLLAHISTRIDVKTGIRPRGDSTRQTGVYSVSDTTDSLTIDTKSYEMPVGGTYQIAASLTEGKAVSVKESSTNGKIASVTKLANGNYQVTGTGVGTAFIMFDVYDKNSHLLTHVSTRVDVKDGGKPHGDSARQYGIF